MPSLLHCTKLYAPSSVFTPLIDLVPSPQVITAPEPMPDVEFVFKASDKIAPGPHFGLNRAVTERMWLLVSLLYSWAFACELTHVAVAGVHFFLISRPATLATLSLTPLLPDLQFWVLELVRLLLVLFWFLADLCENFRPEPRVLGWADARRKAAEVEASTTWKAKEDKLVGDSYFLGLFYIRMLTPLPVLARRFSREDPR
jgi:hypothetical protein